MTGSKGYNFYHTPKFDVSYVSFDGILCVNESFND